MTTDYPSLSPEQRKKLLIVQGQMFRLGVMEAKQSVAANLQVDALVRNATSSLIGSGTGFARHLFSVNNLFNGKLLVMLPAAIRTVGFLSRRRLLIPAGIAIAALSAGYLGWSRIGHRRQEQQALRDPSVGEVALEPDSPGVSVESRSPDRT